MNNLIQQTDPIKCLIIDDDPFIQDLLQDKLSQYFPEIKVLGIASSGKEGIEHINALNPNLIFLDVEMADMTGFEMLSKLETINFKTIFITSYNHYAIKAIRFNALDYLLKPFDLEELKEAIRRFKKATIKFNNVNNISTALNNLKSKTKSNQILTLKTQQGALQLKLEDIIYVEGDGNYSNIHLIKARKELISKTLSALEELLDDKGFFRCHKSYLINKSHIISSPKRFSISLSNNVIIPISRRKKDSFKEWFNSSI
ncbi:LytTR family two component transcriptional regulator [Flavobacteriaceae bacterium MAR_2010_105]|nr:LytTR family two component transcriptional regulator [Flavobacteriaceae bacterium MAR_2010_105]